MDYFVWKSVPVGNACLLDAMDNVDNDYDLIRGLPYGGDFPKNARMRMSERHKKDTGLIDDVANLKRIKICSARLVEFLKARQPKNVEFLPLAIVDHKGKVASKDYFIVHPIKPQDALDLEASQPRYNAHTKTEIDTVQKLVIDEKRVDPGVEIFRLQAFFSPVIITGVLAEALKAEGFKGIYIQTLDRYGK